MCSICSQLLFLFYFILLIVVFLKATFCNIVSGGQGRSSVTEQYKTTENHSKGCILFRCVLRCGSEVVYQFEVMSLRGSYHPQTESVPHGGGLLQLLRLASLWAGLCIDSPAC